MATIVDLSQLGAAKASGGIGAGGIGAGAGKKERPNLFFDRPDFDRLTSLYGRGQLDGIFADYGLAVGPEFAAFLFHAHTSQMPLYRVEMRPALAKKQGKWMVIGQNGQVLKRGHELADVLSIIERKLLRDAL